MQYSRSAALLALSLAAAFVAGCGHKPSAGGGKHAPGGGGPDAPVPVQTTTVQLGTISRSVSITGSIAALEDSTLSARVAGRISAVYVREGDPVHAGQVLVQQDTTDLQATVNNAQAQVANAESLLAQAQTNYDIQKSQAVANVENAQAAVRVAQAAYSKAKQGSRPQQKLEGQSAVEQAQANMQNAGVTLQRDKYLYSQGALAAADLDTAQTNYTVAVEQYKNAQAALSLTIAGNYQQDIASAREQVTEAKTALQNQIANEKQVLLHQQEITAARAQVAEAKATLTYDQEQVGYATITAPFNGIVATRDAQPGQVASPGTPLIEVVNVSTAYFEPTISEEFYADVRVGNPVQVRSDALPGRVFIGHVAAIFPSANSSSRVFSLRVDIPNPDNALRPGMFARGQLQTVVHHNVIVVPVAALMAQQQNGLAINTSSQGTATGETQMPQQQVMLVGPGHKAIAQPVKVGIVSGGNAEIVSGLKPGDTLITTGAGLLQPGQPVRVVNNDTASQMADASGING
jgi:HlyD family secretion protein